MSLIPFSSPSVSPDINDCALSLWRASGYTDAQVTRAGEQFDKILMGAKVTFLGNGNIHVAISQRVWDKQEGHYPSVAEYFQQVAQCPQLINRRGSLLVWLEDGMYEFYQRFSWEAPMLCFGRHLYDNHTFLIPDPAYMGSYGYKADREEIKEFETEIRYEDKMQTMFFRGAATGLGIEQEWKTTARGRVCLLSQELGNPEILDAKITKINHLSDDLQKTLTDTGIVGDYVSFLEMLQYRYLLHADGYCCSWQSLFRKLASSSVVVRIMDEYEQWFYRDLIPWYHYIPVRPDLRHLTTIYEWMKAHDGAVQQIIRNAHQFLDERLSFDRNVMDTAELCSKILDCRRE